MDRTSSLAGAYAKLDRADEHFKALQAEIEAFVQTNEDAARAKLQDIDGQTFYVMEAHVVSDPPARVGLILGDAIQNLRAALDHTVWQLVGFHGGEPDSRNQFPIYTVPPNPDRWGRMVKGIGAPDLTLIEWIQPHLRPDPATQPLAVLADLSNTDKHQVILATVLTIAMDPSSFPRFDRHNLEVLDQMRVTYDKRLEPGTEIFRVPVRVTGPDPHMKVEGSFPVGIAFGEALYKGEGINELRRYIRHLVKAFENPETLEASLVQWSAESAEAP
jgi:hypothetical protein